jgi:hypothetical protein
MLAILINNPRNHHYPFAKPVRSEGGAAPRREVLPKRGNNLCSFCNVRNFADIRAKGAKMRNEKEFAHALGIKNLNSLSHTIQEAFSQML